MSAANYKQLVLGMLIPVEKYRQKDFEEFSSGRRNAALLRHAALVLTGAYLENVVT